jgi:hypothetical protein
MNPTLQEKLDQLNKERVELDAKYKQLKGEYTKFINDKNVPLMERWTFFVNAPAEMKGRHDWLLRPSSKFLKWVMEHWFDAPEVYGRGKPIYVAELFEDLVNNGKIHMGNVYLDDGLTQGDVEAGLEELLRTNLEYFTYDW